MSTHKAGISSGGDTWQGVCVCGWLGTRAQPKDVATREAWNHEARRLEEQVATLTRERDARFDCRGGPGATSPACGGCATCLHREIERLTRERDEARADAARLREYVLGAAGTLDLAGKHPEAAWYIAEMGTTSADWLAERLVAQREACAETASDWPPTEGGAEELRGKVRATPLVNGSDSWLAERDAATRDAALEEAADCFGMSADQERIRALKRGVK